MALPPTRIIRQQHATITTEPIMLKAVPFSEPRGTQSTTAYTYMKPIATNSISILVQFELL